MTTAEREKLIAEVKRLDAEATPGPLVAENLEVSNGHHRLYWVSRLVEGIQVVIEIRGDEEHAEAIWKFADAEAFAFYRTAAPLLAAELEAAGREIAALRSQVDNIASIRHKLKDEITGVRERLIEVEKMRQSCYDAHAAKDARIAELESAKEADWQVLARLSIENADLTIHAIKRHREETGSFLPEAHAAVRSARAALAKETP